MRKKNYIRIRNVSEQENLIVPRVALEKLGLSTKRDDASTIGRFGSGIKFAPIAALRNGWEWWFVGKDKISSYHMQYIVQEEDGVDCIWYDYGTDLKPSSFTLGAGELSWSDAFQIIREPIANAIDGVKDFGGDWSIDIVKEIGEVEDNAFDVYITAAPELVEVINNIEKYFSFNTDRLYTTSNAAVLKKTGSDVKVFSQDVRIFTRQSQPSLFDYTFDFIDLNEERTVKSEWDMSWKIANLISNLSDENLIKSYIKSAVETKPGYEMYEWVSLTAGLYGHGSKSGNWCGVFKDIYGDNAVIYPATAASVSIKTGLKIRNQTGVLVESDDAYKFLSSMGITTYLDSLGEAYEYDIDEDVSKYPSLTTAIAYASNAIPAMKQYISNIGVVCGDAADSVKGMTINLNDPEKCRILISERHIQDASVSDLIGTIVHEYDHASTKAGDGYSSEGIQFRDIADRHIGRLIMNNYKPNPFFVEDGVVCFKVSDMGMIGNGIVAITEHIRMLDCFFMKIGNTVVKAFGSDIEQNFGNEHQPHFCQDATIVSYPTFTNIERIEIV